MGFKVPSEIVGKATTGLKGLVVEKVLGRLNKCGSCYTKTGYIQVALDTNFNIIPPAVRQTWSYVTEQGDFQYISPLWRGYYLVSEWGHGSNGDFEVLNHRGEKLPDDILLDEKVEQYVKYFKNDVYGPRGGVYIPEEFLKNQIPG